MNGIGEDMQENFWISLRERKVSVQRDEEILNRRSNGTQIRFLQWKLKSEVRISVVVASMGPRSSIV